MLLPVFFTLTPTHWFGVLGGCNAVVRGIYRLSSWHVRRLGKADDAFDTRIPTVKRSVEMVKDVGSMKASLSSIEATLSSIAGQFNILTGQLNIQTES